MNKQHAFTSTKTQYLAHPFLVPSLSSPSSVEAYIQHSMKLIVCPMMLVPHYQDQHFLLVYG